MPKEVRLEVVGQMANRYDKEGIFDEDRIMRRLPSKFRKALLLSMYKPQLVRCPLFLGMPDVVISTIAMLMRPYLAVTDDVIFGENEVGDAMFIIISGEVKLRSVQCPKYNGLAWLDGAFIGEPPLLAMGCGPLRNRHVYTAHSVVETDLSYLPQGVLEQVEVDFPELRKQIRRLAMMRAGRFDARYRATGRAGNGGNGADGGGGNGGDGDGDGAAAGPGDQGDGGYDGGGGGGGGGAPSSSRKRAGAGDVKLSKQITRLQTTVSSHGVAIDGVAKAQARMESRVAAELAEIRGLLTRLAASPVALRAAADACPDSDPLEGP
eukprot:SAG22_NODE_1141_length_5388_cov_2.279259_2_plen_322_part_00